MNACRLRKTALRRNLEKWPIGGDLNVLAQEVGLLRLASLAASSNLLALSERKMVWKWGRAWNVAREERGEHATATVLTADDSRACARWRG